MPASIQEALTDSLLSFEDMTDEYAAYVSLTNRILGAPPKFMALAHFSPLTKIFYLNALRPCLRVPVCDINMSPIPPHLRRAMMLESSISHRCAYCTAHLAGMGDVLRGPLVAQCTRRGDYSVATAQFSDDEFSFRDLVRDVCAFPSRFTRAARDDMINKHGKQAFDHLASMISFMAWLNYTMAASGMRIESRMVPFAEEALHHLPLPFNFRDGILDDNEEHLGKEAMSDVKPTPGPLKWLASQIGNVWKMLSLIQPLAVAGLDENRAYAGLPETLPALDEWCTSHFNTLLPVFHAVNDPILRRSVALSLRLVFVEEDVKWTRAEKTAFLYVFAAGVMDNALQEDAVAMRNAIASASPDKQTSQNDASSDSLPDLEQALLIATSPDDATDAFSAALKFMHASAGPAGQIQEPVIDGLLKHVQVQRSIVDLAGTAGHFGFLHRVSALYAPPESV